MSDYILSVDPKNQLTSINVVIKELRKLARKGQLLNINVSVEVTPVIYKNVIRHTVAYKTITIQAR